MLYSKLRNAAINGDMGTREQRDTSTPVKAAFWDGYASQEPPKNKASDAYVAYVLGTFVRRHDKADEEQLSQRYSIEGHIVSKSQYGVWAAMPEGKWIDAAKLGTTLTEYNRTTIGRIMQELYALGILQRKHDVPPYYRRKAP